MNIKHILVEMDPDTEHQPALEKAIALAKTFNATIELFLVVYNKSLVIEWLWNDEQQEEAMSAYIQSKKRWLNSYVDQVVKSEISVSTDVSWHKPLHQGILKKIASSNADLLIKSVAHPRTLEKILFTNDDWQLLKTCPVPLLLVKQTSQSDYQHIMAAVDPTQSHDKSEGLDKVILGTTMELSDVFSATPSVAHCYEPIDIQLWQGVGFYAPNLGLTFENYNDYIDQMTSTQNKQFEEMIEKYDFNEDNVYLESGSPVYLLPELVENHKIDLMVVGTTYRTGLLGSTVEKILNNVNCDILAVKDADFKIE